MLELLSTLTRPDKMSDEEFEKYKSKFKEDLMDGYITVNEKILKMTYAHKSADVFSANENNETRIRAAAKETYSDK